MSGENVSERKVAVVTGGSRGIGRAICLALAAQNCDIALIYAGNEDAANKTVSECVSLGARAVSYKCDVSDYEETEKTFKQIKADFSTFDILVNNAGIAQQKLFTDITDEDWYNMINTHLTGAFYMCRAVLPYMIHEKSGRIINIASMWGEVGGSCEVHYSAAKAGLIGLTKALAKEVAPSGITVNCVSPGVIMTNMMSGFDEETLESLREETPVGRLGTPRDVAKAVEFLADDSSSFITGVTLKVNGGIF